MFRFARPVSEAPSNEVVFLLHGLGRTALSMLFLARRLRKAGYSVVARTYRSTRAPIEDHVAWLEDQLGQSSRDAARLHFVTHSLGGIVLRYFLNQKQIPNLGRVVMLSPPNAGSELVDAFRRLKLFQFATGPSAQQLGTEPDSIPNRLGPVHFELGVIAGNASFNPVASLLIPGVSDGIVSVERSKVEGMKDLVVVKRTHTFIMNAPEVAEQVIAFLRTGAFRKEEAER